MKIILTFCFSFVLFLSVNAQENFQFKSSKRFVKLPFKLVNNLIILPIKVNGISLNFLVDTGIKETILFSLDENKEIPLFDIEKIKFKGLGTQGTIEGLKSYRNILSVDGLEFKNQEIVVILDQEFNFSSVLGLEVNGIIGHHFFSKEIIKIDYERKIITIYNKKKFKKRKILSKFQGFDFQLEEAKPYITLQVKIEDCTFDAKCLIDSGNSDGLWLFPGKSDAITIPEPNFEDYLGRGFSGDVFGKKAKIDSLSLGNYNFNNVVTAFPEKKSFDNLVMVENRMGSIGGDFLRRFNVIFDYQNQKLFLKKNKHFNKKFNYNKTGITLHHAGLQWYKEEILTDGLFLSYDMTKTKSYLADIQYNFKLIPIFQILHLRKNSIAENVGLQTGDEIVKINGKNASRMSLEKMNYILNSDSQNELLLVVLRKGKELTFRVKIVDLL